jgi:hypothetical protein
MLLSMGQPAEHSLVACERRHHLMLFTSMSSIETLWVLMVRLPSLLHCVM